MAIEDLWRITRSSPRCQVLAKPFKFPVTELIGDGHNITVNYAPNRSETFRTGATGFPAFSKFLGHSFTELVLGSSNFENTWKWLNEEQTGLKKLKLAVKNVKDPEELLNEIMKKSKLEKLEELVLWAKFPKNFKFTQPLIFENSLKQLDLWNASWITIENVLNVKIDSCNIYGAKFNDRDLNSLLRFWMDMENVGHFPRTAEYLAVGKSGWWSIDKNVLFEGVHHELLLQQDDHSCYILWREDGTFSSVIVEAQMIIFVPHCTEQ